MCGIAGILYKNSAAADSSVGKALIDMLDGCQHRGPDSTGYAIYGQPGRNEYVMRFKVAEQDEMAKGFDIHDEVKRRRATVEERLASLSVQVIDREEATEYAYRYRIHYDGDMKKLVDYVEDVEGTEILSMGNALELIKDLGDAARVADQYALRKFKGTHGIGHTRMATESRVDIAHSHPFWARPFRDIAVVHNGTITNYHALRRRRDGRRAGWVRHVAGRIPMGLLEHGGRFDVKSGTGVPI